MSEYVSAPGHLKVKSKKNVQSYRPLRNKEQFTKDFCLIIEAKNMAQEINVLEIIGENDAPITTSISKLEWIGPFPNIKKVFLIDLQFSGPVLDKQDFLELEYVVLKNVSFHHVTLEEFIQTLPHTVKNLSLVHSGPFCQKSLCPKTLLPHLEQLDLSRNQLHELPAWVESLTSLKRLTLDANKLESLPLYLKHLPKLNHLSLDGNSFSDETKGQIQRDFNLWF